VSESLKPCPFCGTAPTVEYWHGGPKTKRRVGCDNEECAPMPHVTGPTEAEAVAAWNRRAAPAPPSDEGRAVRIDSSDDWRVKYPAYTAARGLTYEGGKSIEFVAADFLRMAFVGAHVEDRDFFLGAAEELEETVALLRRLAAPLLTAEALAKHALLVIAGPRSGSVEYVGHCDCHAAISGGSRDAVCVNWAWHAIAAAQGGKP